MYARKPDFQDWVKVFSRFRPIVTVPVAVIGYVVCHHYAMQPIVTGAGAMAAADAAAMTIVRLLAVVFQYLLPLCLVMSTVLWFLGFVERRRVRRLADASMAPDVLAGLSWTDFEKVIAAGFAAHSFVVQLTAEGADGGVDIVLEREGQRFLVQAKHWRARSVGVDVVRALYGVVCADEAAGGYVVSSGVFTKAAADFATGKPLWLMSGARLRDLLAAGGTDRDGRLVLERRESAPGPSDVPCPLCERPMVLREAGRGGYQGKRFFGCSHYPACSGLRPVD